MPTVFRGLLRDTVVLACVWLATATPAADIHLEPGGNDAADGSAERPVASLRRPTPAPSSAVAG